jgi:glyoxylase-like metal-dependent hydrolase (beta-lactamase superfamily II)
MKIKEDIHLIRCPHRSYFVSAGLILGETITLIDGGREESPEETIYPHIQSLGRDPEEVSTILLTHAHWDHCAGAARIQSDTGCEVGIHTLGEIYLQNPEKINGEMDQRFPYISRDKFPRFDALEPDFTFNDGDIIDLNERKFKIIHTPGHSVDSSTIVDLENSVFFTGDSFQGRGEGRPLIFHNIRDYVSSSNKLREEIFDYMVVGHPFPPYNRGLLIENEAKTFLTESSQAMDDLKNSLTRILHENKLITFQEIKDIIPEIRDITLGCLLEDLESEGRIKRIREQGKFKWTTHIDEF